MQSNELPQVTLENIMIATQVAQWSRPQVACALSRERRSSPQLVPGVWHGWLWVVPRTLEERPYRPVPKDTMQPLPKLSTLRPSPPGPT